MTPNANATAIVEAPEPSHACIRCGREGVPAENALCEVCNPLELAQPSATQVHGIAALGILIFIAVLAVAGRAALAGTGPFTGSIDTVTPTADGLDVTLVVSNLGTKNAATTCLVGPAADATSNAHQVVQTPVVPAGGEIRFTARVTKFGSELVSLSAECQSP
jgi:hypothetical protein